MDRKLLDYLPPVLREVLEFQAINAANEPEISIAWDALALVLANQFLDTATASGVAVWERELNIRPKDTDTLEVRKARIKALWNLELPYTLPWLKNWLTGLCGELGHEESIVDYTINIQLDYTVLPDADALAAEILDMLLMVRPANMRVLMTSFLQSYQGIDENFGRAQSSVDVSHPGAGLCWRLRNRPEFRQHCGHVPVRIRLLLYAALWLSLYAPDSRRGAGRYDGIPAARCFEPDQWQSFNLYRTAPVPGLSGNRPCNSSFASD